VPKRGPVQTEEILPGACLLAEFTAGAAIAKGQVVVVTGDDTVAPFDSAIAGQDLPRKVVGVAYEDIAAGAKGRVIIYGIAEVVADGAVSPGDNVVPAGTGATAGRVVSENSVTPTFTGDAVADHTHTQAATGAAGGHDHAAVETDGVDATPGAHQTARTYPGSGVNSSLLVGVATAGQAAATTRTDSAGAHTPSGTISAVEHGRVLGKALTGAAAAGEKIKVLVCLAG